MNREEIEWITRNLFVGNKLWTGDAQRHGRQGVRPARHQGADHPVRVDGRQHHAAAAGVQLGRRRLRLDRRDQGARAGDRRPAAPGHRPPRHLRLRQGREEGARADRLGAEVDRGAAAGPLRHGDQREQGARRQARVRGRVPASAALEEIAARLNRFERADEKPFEAVAALSDFNQRAYELFAQPFVQVARQRVHGASCAPVPSAALPALGVLGPQSVARMARPGGGGGQGAAPAGRRRQRRAQGREDRRPTAISASLDYYRAMRDAASEAAFFQTYGNVFSLYLADKQRGRGAARTRIAEPRELPFVQEALASIAEGGYAEALARVGVPARAQGRAAAAVAAADEAGADRASTRDLLPDMRARPVAAHPRRAGDHRPLRARAGDRDAAAAAREARRPRAAGRRWSRGCSPTSACSASKPSTEQLAMLENIGETLDVAPNAAGAARAARKAARSRARSHRERARS